MNAGLKRGGKSQPLLMLAAAEQERQAGLSMLIGYLAFYISFKISKAPHGQELNKILLKVGQVWAPCI